MSRELKFRVWNTVLKKYVCPNVVEQKDGLWLILGNEDNLYEFEQYTGLKDKNGKEIYEGDIVRRKKEGEFETVGVVEWRENGGMFWIDRYYFMSKDGLEVIGNIHENPELLGGEKD